MTSYVLLYSYWLSTHCCRLCIIKNLHSTPRFVWMEVPVSKEGNKNTPGLSWMAGTYCKAQEQSHPELEQLFQMDCRDSLAIRASNGLRQYGCFSEAPDVKTNSHNVSVALYRRANTKFRIGMNTYGDWESTDSKLKLKCGLFSGNLLEIHHNSQGAYTAARSWRAFGPVHQVRQDEHRQLKRALW